MARCSALSQCAVAAICCLGLQCTLAFLPAPSAQSLRGDAALVAAGAAALATIPGSAEAFVFNGKEYFDVTFGISPLAWGFTIFMILYYAATLKRTVERTNVPLIKKPFRPSGFVGKEKENKTINYKAL
ncbi:unnamed protein product [Polarella glacialis]|uniref:Uncharacterized protein n=1 Tax=Polarella glacialis TaxID=89957 RepID=A0A813J713_POLGL|nr:unnamed protein product [Polarella glacialis]